MVPRSIAQLSVLLQSGALDPIDLVEETLAAIESHPDKAVFTSLTESRARAEAEASRRRLREGRSRGILEGVPVAWKDLFDMIGLPTTAGSHVLKTSMPASSDAAIVRTLADAGMVSVGRVNMSEFAFSGIGINPHFGTPRNPASPVGEHRIPGGSSSGSGVAVAAGLVPVSIGTDTSGSVRIPAAFNGVVGYKATRGRYSMEGVFPLAKSLDSLGSCCQSVQDAIWVDEAMRGIAAAGALPRPDPAHLTFVIPETIVFDEAEPEVVTVFEAAVERLAQSGARIRRAAFPEISAIFDLMARHGALVTAEAYVLHRTRVTGAAAAEMDPRVVKRTLAGQKVTLSDYVETLAARDVLMANFEARLERDELMLSPTLPHVAPPLQPLLDDEDMFFRTNAKTLRNTLIGNFLDGCGVSLPCGIGADRLPVGLLLSGPRGSDSWVLGSAAAVEACLDRWP